MASFFQNANELFASAAERVQRGQTDITKRPTGNGRAVIVEAKLDRRQIVAYLRPVFETAGAAAATGPDAETDLCADEELCGRVVAGAHEDGDLAESGILTADAKAEIVGFAGKA